MKWIAAHKVLLMAGLVLGGVVLYLHRRSSTANSESPNYGGVATSPYSDSAAPQFSFDLGDLLGGQPAAPAGSAAAPPGAIPSGGDPNDPTGGGGGVANPTPVGVNSGSPGTFGGTAESISGWPSATPAEISAIENSFGGSYSGQTIQEVENAFRGTGAPAVVALPTAPYVVRGGPPVAF